MSDNILPSKITQVYEHFKDFKRCEVELSYKCQRFRWSYTYVYKSMSDELYSKKIGPNPGRLSVIIWDIFVCSTRS